MGSAFSNMPMTRKLMLVLVVIGLLPAAIVGLIANFEAALLLEKEAINNLTAVRESRKSGIERYLNRIDDQVTIMAGQQSTVSAMKDFSRDFKRYADDLPANSLNSARRTVSDYYQDEFSKELKRRIKNQQMWHPY